MSKVKNLKFKGDFRSYQKNVLDQAKQYLKNGKIHIVAAPGSGKTTLGIELIRRLEQPALILTPTVTIRQQWGERIEDSFLPEDHVASDYLSYDLRKPSDITSITYQALYAAFNKLAVEEVDDDEVLSTSKMDYSDFDLLEIVRESNIKTICLDEAHHLKNEWHKALEAFIVALGKEVTIIALTATPPYDSTPAEWKKYTDLCGEIDEEIYVPQLVAQKTLCPHQDYIYFNYPTDEEAKVFKQYKMKAVSCTQEIIQSELFDEMLSKSGLLTDYRKNEETILENAKGFIALLCLAQYRGNEIPHKVIKLLSPSGKLPAFSLMHAENAFQFVMDTPTIFTQEVSIQLYKILSENALLDRKQVQLKSSNSINKMLLSSTGKLIGINEIVKNEVSSLNKELRMLILTDYIKKDLLKIIGTNEVIATMGAVPIFESVRRSSQGQVNLAVLSGQLVIIPKEIMQQVTAIADERKIPYSYKDLENTDYVEISFSGSSKNKVAIITQAFGQGFIQVLVGTKSLLGEGWDSPCINSLILASFVGSFVLSNQMRGRAIRMDQNNPDKVSNIWHLVTVEPECIFENSAKQILSKPFIQDKNSLTSDDFEMLKRRFNCFLAPAYSRNVIENRIERIDILKPPFDKQGIANINQQMMELSQNRKVVRDRWKDSIGNSGNMEILEMDEFSKDVRPKGFLFQNILATTFWLTCINLFIRSGFTSVIQSSDSLIGLLFGICVVIVLGYFSILGMFRIACYCSPKKTIQTLSKCILKTLKEVGEVESKGAEVEIVSDKIGASVYCCITNATMHEKYVFADAMKELLTSIENPRYLLIKTYRFSNLSIFKYSHSYACPSVIATKKENVEILARHLSKSTGKITAFYTRNEKGRKILLKCRKRSYINRNETFLTNRKVTNKWM